MLYNTVVRDALQLMVSGELTPQFLLYVGSTLEVAGVCFFVYSSLQ